MRPPAFALIALFSGIYLALFSAGSFLLPEGSVAGYQWVALGAAIVASVILGRIDRAHAAIGLSGSRVAVTRDLALGVGVGLLAVGLGDLLMMATTTLRHGRGQGIDGWELWLIFFPAAVHEEILFRGYVLQRLGEWSRVGAVVVTSVFFSALHLGNAAVSPLALLNIFLAGLLLGAAFFVFRSLWFPIAIHWAWNFFSGPFLGHEVSGYRPSGSLLTAAENGPILLTGGSFGVEGSVYMTAIEVIMVAALWRTAWKRNRNESVPRKVDQVAPSELPEHPENDVTRLENA